MKQIFIVMLCVFLFSMKVMAEKPVYGIELDREVEMAIIEGETYWNVVIELKSDDDFSSGVKILVKDSMTGKKIYKKKFKKSYLYVFTPEGTVVVGVGDALTQVIIGKSNETGSWLAKIREKGIY